MMEGPVPVVIGGMTYVCPPMPFYCLERAWPHIQNMSRMGALNRALAAAQLRQRNAQSDEEIASATRAVAVAEALVARENADFIAMTHTALEVIVAALALDPNAPTYDTLSKQMRPTEIAGVHEACTALMDASGLTSTLAPGERLATGQAPVHLNGAGSSPN
jgi:hypothetical protein